MRPERVLSIDLAYKSTRDLGVCLLERRISGPVIHVSFLSAQDVGLNDPPEAAQFGRSVVDFCQRQSISIVLIDGPQGWKDPDSELPHSRHCEKALNAPAKTGIVGHVKPRSYLPFVAFSISLFAELVELGAALVFDGAATLEPGLLTAAESLPLAAWRSLGIVPLPSKKKASQRDIEDRLCRLESVFPFQLNRKPGHDELQALIAGLAGIAIFEGCNQYGLYGGPPRKLGSHFCEGFIVLPEPTSPDTASCGRVGNELS